MNLINLTPHTLNVIAADGTELAIPSSGVARVAVQNVANGEINGIAVAKSVYGEVEGLPAPEEGVTYIVSMLVGGHVHGRTDLVGPDTGKGAVRNKEGQIVAVKGLVRFE